MRTATAINNQKARRFLHEHSRAALNDAFFLQWHPNYSAMNIEALLTSAKRLNVPPTLLLENGFGRDSIRLSEADQLCLDEGEGFSFTRTISAVSA